jgi:chromatin segregation and condensation protein Rec8/ScpA/Scc1 (kleisin family)
MGVVLHLGRYQGNLAGLADRLRRRRLDAREIEARELVRQLKTHWATAHGIDTVADELPLAAWVIRQKALALLPAEPAPEATEAVSAWPEARAWGEALRRFYEQRAPAVAGPPRWPDALPPTVADATPERLRASWPPTRPARVPPAPVPVPAPLPLWRRALTVARRLRQGGPRQPWSRLVAGWGRPRRVDTFFILLVLWHRGTVELAQPEPASEPEVTWHGRRIPSRSAAQP